jgi:protein phosphatase
VAHVGDSRVYRLRDWVIEQLTEDHMIVTEAKRHAADPRPPRKRKYVTRALGTRMVVEPDISLVDTFPGDLFLLCSDGLTDLVADEEIVEVLRRARGSWRKAIRALIELANRRGGLDNVTVVIAEVVAEEDDEDDTTELVLGS